MRRSTDDDARKLIGLAIIPVCLPVLILPHKRTDANLCLVFGEHGLKLISIKSASGCDRVGANRYSV